MAVVADIGPCSTNTTQEAKNKLLMDETLCCSLLVHGEDFCSTPVILLLPKCCMDQFNGRCAPPIDNAHSTRQRLPCDLSCAIECALKRGRWLSAGGVAVMLFDRQGQPTVTP
ncbi:hypothetical protein FCULG_00002355 [Fusarium culmorum]|uniref:Uncharacterized protein n=1 Tax=Fusarium culmorum TaxID=5516 RepID=A0A2T4GPC3_FUSCU|nr:hypothetical protein FCULG_00002355 [Fusarium culmorum]